MAVLGAGVVGVLTAWYLSQKGHAVTVIDRGESVANGTSHANAGQLSYSFTDALARPEFLRKLPALMLGRDAGVLFRPGRSSHLLRWGRAFLRECTAGQARANTVYVLQLAMRSAALMDELMAAAPLEFSFVRAGKLVLLPGPQELAAAERSVLLKQENGCFTEILARDRALEIEPALGYLQSDFVAATYSRNDHVADARAFTVSLAGWLAANRGVDFRLRENITALGTAGGMVRSVITERNEHRFDAVVVCLGTGSTDLLAPLRIDPAICPVRGYSVTLPVGERAPSASVSDPAHRIVLSKIGPWMRIAGFADFVGFDTRHDASRIGALVAIARRIAPLAADYGTADVQGWAGFRPMTPDGRPRVGATRIGGLYLNTGHGMLGWTLACVTAHDVAQCVS